MLAGEIIDPAIIKWLSPIVFPTMRNGSVRYCDDSRKLNSATVFNSYLICRKGECTNFLANLNAFPALNINAGYGQIKINKDAKEKTAFVRPHELFPYKRMAFELKNTPATFQRGMDVIRFALKWHYALVFLENVVVFLQTPLQDIEHVATVLRLIKSAGLTFILKKCFFVKAAIDYVGYTIRHGTLEVVTETTVAIRGFRSAVSISELRSFLGLCNVN